MKFTLEASKLAALLSSISGCIPSRSTMPILQHSLIVAEFGRVSASASSIDMEASAWTSAVAIEREGSAALHAEILLGIVKRLPKALDVTIDSQEEKTSLTAARNTYQIRTLPADLFPIKPEHDGLTFSVPAVDLKALLDATLACVTSNATKWYYAGVHLHTLNGKLIAVATDDYRLGCREMDAPAVAADMPPVTIPGDSARVIRTILESEEGDVELVVSDTRLTINATGLQFSTQLIGEKYPDYQMFIPKKNGTLATVQPSEMITAIERARIVYTGTVDKVPAVGMVAEGGELKLLAGGRRGVEEVTEFVPAEISELPDVTPEFAANAKFLTEMLGLWPDVKVDIQAPATAGAPILFTSRELPAYRQMIMPMRR